MPKEKLSRKIVVRQQIIIERIVPLSAWDDSSVLTHAEAQFEELLEPILEELRELGLAEADGGTTIRVSVSQPETFVKEGNEQ